MAESSMSVYASIQVRVRQSLNARTVILDIYSECNCRHEYIGQVYSLGEKGAPGFVPPTKMDWLPREALSSKLRVPLERQLNTVVDSWRSGDAYQVFLPDGPVVKLASIEPRAAAIDKKMTLPGLSPRVRNIESARKRRHIA